jgi:hypothetical protein
MAESGLGIFDAIVQSEHPHARPGNINHTEGKTLAVA